MRGFDETNERKGIMHYVLFRYCIMRVIILVLKLYYMRGFNEDNQTMKVTILWS
jgi:hypothetical protein